jgi:hypothetical protein
MSGQQRDGRRGAVFSMRLTDEQREDVERRMLGGGPRSLGPWLLWAALSPGRVLPTRAGITSAPRYDRAGAVLPPPATGDELAPPLSKRIILDLCAGTGAWSEPYKRAGYQVIRVTLPKRDVRTFVAPTVRRVWGVLAAPPCNEFTLARNGGGRARDYPKGMECVNACLRIIQQVRPRWWALENPVGKLSIWLGTPRDVFEPCDFGDPWTKRTALWGDFVIPRRGAHVRPARGATSIHSSSKERARTPPGFARAFFAANP